jgi:hypothetical protein
MTNVNNCSQKLRASLHYVTTVTARHDGQVLSGRGEGVSAKIAYEMAHENILPAMQQAIELQDNARRLEEEKKGDTWANFNAAWFASCFLRLHCGMSVIELVNEEGLADYTKRHMEAAKLTQPYIVGLETEGGGASLLRPYKHAHVMQLSAGNDHETVVFRTTSRCLEIVEAFFGDLNMTIAMFDRTAERGGLVNLFGMEKTDSMMERFKDVQEIAADVLKMPKPSLECMVTKMFNLPAAPLTKFARGSTKQEIGKTYELRYEGQGLLDDEAIMYAGLDAIITKWAYEQFHEEACSHRVQAAVSSLSK